MNECSYVILYAVIVYFFLPHKLVGTDVYWIEYRFHRIPNIIKATIVGL